MSAILNRLVSQLMAKGMSKQSAMKVATKKLQDYGNLDSNGNDTMNGLIRGNMTPAQRAIDREIKYRGGLQNDYQYNPYTNKATKRK